METATVEKAKKSVNKTVNKISEQLNSAANGDDSHPKKSTVNVDNDKSTTTNNDDKKPVIAEDTVVEDTQKNIKSDAVDSIVQKNKIADEGDLAANSQDLLKANISMT